MNPERDKYLTETVLGECWHEWDDGLENILDDADTVEPFCRKCKYTDIPYFQNNFSKPGGFFKLWNECKEKKWWGEFWDSIYIKCHDTDHFILHFIGKELSLIHPDRFADAVYEFLKENK